MCPRSGIEQMVHAVPKMVAPNHGRPIDLFSSNFCLIMRCELTQV